MAKFKVGDRLVIDDAARINRANPSNKRIAKELRDRVDLTVTEVTSGGFVRFGHNTLAYCPERFKLAPAEAPKFSVGDRVEVVKGGPSFEPSKGMVGTILEKSYGISNIRVLVGFTGWRRGHGEAYNEWYFDTDDLSHKRETAAAPEVDHGSPVTADPLPPGPRPVLDYRSAQQGRLPGPLGEAEGPHQRRAGKRSSQEDG